MRASPSSRPTAFVLGMSPHGLAITRALARHDVPVLAFEQAMALPSVATRYAQVHAAAGLNSERTAEFLLAFQRCRRSREPAVLFATSDHMVRSIARHWDDLRDDFRTSWSASVELVPKLIDKSNLGALCLERDLRYPRSFVLSGPGDVAEAVATIGMPLLVKPISPLSGFKALRVDSAGALAVLVERFTVDLPFLVQRWIDGGDDSLWFCSMVLDRGQPVATFTGRKIEAHPPGTGVGTIVESCRAPDVVDLSRRFIEGLDLSGPIAIEYKRDADGELWLIEPNVGRTEYSVDLIIQSGINFPLIEYQLALGLPVTAPVTQQREVVWYDTDRDPLCFMRHCRRERTVKPRGKHRVFPYWGHADSGPLWRATRRFLARALEKLRNSVSPAAETHGVRVERVNGFANLPDEAHDLLQRVAGSNPFLSIAWFEVFEREVARAEGPFFWVLIWAADGTLRGVWPFMRRRQRGRMVLRAMGNYYTPYMTLPFDYVAGDASMVFGVALRDVMRSCDILEVEPLAPDDPLLEFLARNPGKWPHERDTCSINWFQQIGDLEQYRKSRPGPLRSVLKRKYRALARTAEVTVDIIEHPGADLERALDDYFTVYANSWKRPEPYPEFIREFARMAARRGWLRLGLMYVDGVISASQFWLVDHGTAYIYKLAYDERFAPHSVGTLLTWRLIQHVHEHDRARRIDYLTGNDAYKQDWMDESRALVALTLINLRRPLGALSYLKWRMSGRSQSRRAQEFPVADQERFSRGNLPRNDKQKAD